MKFFFLLISLFSFSALADVAIVTFNMAQLKRNGTDLVACTKRRVPFQVKAMLEDETAPVYTEKNFVLLIQESWTKRSFNTLREVALKKGYSFFPDDYEIVKNSGQISITNLPVLEKERVPFTFDKYAKKGLLYLKLDLGDGKTLGAINIHTGFSDKNSFSEEHLRHFEELGDLAKAKKDLTTHFVIGGDFNAGPDIRFKTVLYDAPLDIWEHGLMPIINPLGLRYVRTPEFTWDETNNELVRKPPLILRLRNLFKNGYSGWDNYDSTLDHIFVKAEEVTEDAKVVFKEKVPLKCGGREDKDGLLNLSDHYGVLVRLKTDTPAP